MCHIDLWFTEDSGHATFEELIVNALDIIAMDGAQALESIDSEQGAQLVFQLP